MKQNSLDLNVDFIGRQDMPLTKEEHLVISAFIKKSKENRNKKAKRRKIVHSEKQID